MGQVVINGQIFGETNPNIQVIPKYEEGIKIADIIINGQTYPIYVPTNLVQNGGNNT